MPCGANADLRLSVLQVLGAGSISSDQDDLWSVQVEVFGDADRNAAVQNRRRSVLVWTLRLKNKEGFCY